MIPGEYVEIFMSNPFLARSPATTLTVIFFLTLARVLPTIALSPFFGGRVLPHPVKVGFGIMLFAIMFPIHASKISTPIEYNHMLILLGIKEFFIGFILGFMVSIPFQIVESAGILVDHQRGGASLMVNDPVTQNQASPLGTFYQQILIYLFFLANGPFLFIELIATSYDIIPIDGFFSSLFFNADTPFWKNTIHIFGKLMIAAVRLSSPALIMILMTDVFLGIANRLAPQVQITFLGMPLKSLLGLIMVWLGWKILLKQFVKDSLLWLQDLEQIVQSFSIGLSS